jgi:hypothetical protein
MSFIFGAILLAVAILGGGFEIKEIKVSNVTVSVRIIAGIVGLFFIGVGFWPPSGWPDRISEARMSEREHDKDRLGGDYSGFDVNTAEDCEGACKRDAKCAAWTYVKHRGPGATSRTLFPRYRTMDAAYLAQNSIARPSSQLRR